MPVDTMSIGLQKLSSNNPLPQEEPCCACSCAAYGFSASRFCSAVKEGSETIGRGVLSLAEIIADITTSIFEEVFVALESAFGDTNFIANTLRKLDKYVFNMVEKLTRSPNYFDSFRQTLLPTVGFIDAIQIAADVDYYVHGHGEKDSKFNKTARCFGFAANIGVAILWLKDMGFAKFERATALLGAVAVKVGSWQMFSFVPKIVNAIPMLRNKEAIQAIAKTIGEVRLFNFLTKVSFVGLLTRAVTLAYSFMAADSIQRYMHAKNEYQQTDAALDSSYFISELTLDAMVTIGVVNIYALGLVGATAIALGLASFAYKVKHKEQINAVQTAVSV